MQQRYYDPQIGRFLATDPMASDLNNGWNFNRYNYANNNPYKFTDPDGRAVRTDDPASQAAVEKWINQKSPGQFKFDKEGNLQLTNVTNNAKRTSSYYQERLIEAINNKGVVTIGIGRTYGDKNGKQVAFEPKGAVTVGRRGGGDQLVVVNTTNTKVSGRSGNPINLTPGDKLMHELLAHAIPHMVGPDTGNGIENENKARDELGLELRKKDPKHHE